MKAASSEKRREEAKSERMSKLKKRKLPISFKALESDQRLLTMCLGDYLSAERVTPKTTLTKVETSIHALHAAQSAVADSSCALKATELELSLDTKDLAVKFFMRLLDRIEGQPTRHKHDFSLVNEDLKSFLEEQAAFRKVMERTDAGGSVTSGPRALIDAFTDRRGALRLALMERHILLEDVEKLAQFKTRLARFKRFPEHPDLSVKATVAAILRFSFSGETPEARKQRLLTEMKRVDVEYEEDVGASEDFIQKAVDTDVEEVAAITWVTLELRDEADRSSGECCFDECYEDVLQEMEERYYDRGGPATWMTAAAWSFDEVVSRWRNPEDYQSDAPGYYVG